MKKNGFTLIELLAVIIVLGIIAVIAVPMVNNIVLESKKKSYVASARMLVKSTTDKCNRDVLHDKNGNSSYTLESGKLIQGELDIKNGTPLNGEISSDKDCDVALSLNIEKFCIKKDYQENDINIFDYDNENCIIEEVENREKSILKKYNIDDPDYSLDKNKLEDRYEIYDLDRKSVV